MTLRIAFEDFELWPTSFELRRAGERVDLQPKPLRLLIHLATNRDRLVTRDELKRAIWSQGSVSDASLDRAVRAVRRALGDNGREQRYVRTVSRVGYQLVARCTELAPVTSGVHEIPQLPSALAADAS